MTALMSARWVKAWGKLPRWRPVGGLELLGVQVERVRPATAAARRAARGDDPHARGALRGCGSRPPAQHMKSVAIPTFGHGDAAFLRAMRQSILRFMRTDTFAARAGRWSAANRKKAIFGWLAFVILAVAIGSAVGTKTPANDNSTVGDSGRGDKLVTDHYPDSAGESVLIQGRNGQSYRDADVRAAVDQTVKAVSGFKTVQNVDSPYAKGNRGQISPDGRSVLVKFEVKGDDDTAKNAIDPIEAAVVKVG